MFANMRRVGKGFSGVETPLFEGMLVAHEVEEGDDDENVENVNAGDAAEGDVSAANDEDDGIPMNLLQEVMDTCTAQTRRVEHLELDKIAQSLEITKLKRRVKKLERRNKERMIANMDDGADVVLEEAKDVATDAKADQDADVQVNANIQGRTIESQAEIYKIDLDHANQVLSMQKEESEPAELQKVVDIVTTAKIITEVVTTASRTINAADVPIPVATTAAALKLTADPSRMSKGAKEDKYVKRYQAMKKKPQTEAQARQNMMLYLKNVAGFKMDYVKGMKYDDIRPIFEKHFNFNVNFLMKSKEQIDEEESRALKKINETPAEKAAKRRKLDEGVEELKRHLQIVPNEDDDVYTEATPLARKVPVVDYEIYNHNNKPYFKIIRADAGYTCSNLEESKKCSWSSKSEELEAVGIMWCIDNNIYNNTIDFVSREEIPTHKVHSKSDA
nr:hypothetical protein [Tanacetum cinerariifolium]